MFGYYLINFFRGILGNIIYVLLTMIPIAIFVLLNFTAAMIGSSIVGVIFFILRIILNQNSEKTSFYYGVSKIDTIIDKYELSKYQTSDNLPRTINEDIFKRAAQKKPIRAFWAYLWLALHLVIAVVSAVYAIRLTQDIKSDSAIGAVPLIHTAVFQIIYFIVRLVFYIRSTCFKCGNIFCKMEESSELLESNMGTYNKDRDINVNVGSVYSDGKKVANVYRKETRTDTYVSSSSKTLHHCKCLYCNKEYDIVTEYYDSWKT